MARHVHARLLFRATEASKDDQPDDRSKSFVSGFLAVHGRRIADLDTPVAIAISIRDRYSTLCFCGNERLEMNRGPWKFRNNDDDR